ncbi:glycosyltransferase family 2 protein [Stutzerimonas chloritidismutans]|uniref:glycosyltransferase family 2 protein n=1 Tax=Stutzerimonas chloritidismutans TaxID=203192 RepID=UPI0030DE8FB6
MRADITAIILTFNEEKHISRCLLRLAPLVKEVYVVDSFSTDATVALAKKNGAKVTQNTFINQAQQFNWALDTLPIKTDWIMRIDADELIEPDLIEKISRTLPTLDDEIAGVNFKRKHIFMNRWVRRGGRYPLLMLRLWRTGRGRVEDRWMDEHVVVSGGRTVTFEGGFSDHNLNDLTYFTDKHNKYATREAIEVLNQRYCLFAKAQGLTTTSASRQAAIKRFIKEKLYNRIPFTLSALLYFLWRYIFQLGFVDGRSGLVYHFLQGYWYRFLVGAKVMELEKAIAHLHSKQEIIEEVSRLTGHKLNSVI